MAGAAVSVWHKVSRLVVADVVANICQDCCSGWAGRSELENPSRISFLFHPVVTV